MNPSKTAYKDAVFISTHKFIGGPGTPGKLRVFWTTEVNAFLFRHIDC